MSNDIFKEMVADASAFDTVSTESGSKLSNLIRAAQHQKEMQEEFEAKAKEAKVEYLRIVRELIPTEMQEMGMDSVTVDGNAVSLAPFVYASIPEKNKEEAFNFLRSIGEDDIIKNEVKVTFGRGQDNVAGAFYDDCKSQGLHPEQKQAIHPSTLKAWVKERMASGGELNLELFGAFYGTEAKIVRKK